MKILVTLLSLVFTGFFCQQSHGAELNVLVSIAPQKYFVERIAGKSVNVVALAKQGMDPHSFEPGTLEMKVAAEADLYFTIGAPFEAAWLPRLQGAFPKLRVVSTIKDIALHKTDEHEHEKDEHGHEKDEHGHEKDEHGHEKDEHGHEEAVGHHHHGEEDPHVWLAPELVQKMIPIIVDALSEQLPEEKDLFEKNAKAFSDEIASLESSITKLLSDIPVEKRVFMTFHPAWHYFADEFLLKEIAVEVEGKEPGARQLKEIIDAARKWNIKTIFIEPQFPQSAAKAVGQSIGAKLVLVDPLQEDWLGLMNSFSKDLHEAFLLQLKP